MTVDKVTMHHPETGGRFDAPVTGVKVFERSGWVVVSEDDQETPADPKGTAGPAPAEDGSKGPSRTTKTTNKEEGK